MVKDKYAADEEVLRVPIALAMVHLLQMLPAFMLRSNLPGFISESLTYKLEFFYNSSIFLNSLYSPNRLY